MNNIEIFTEKLEYSGNQAENLYYGNSALCSVRMNNLQEYLKKMIELKPTILLVGEAPGYKGCGITGIPFTSEKIIIENQFFNAAPNFTFKTSSINNENTATIIWNVISKWDTKPLLWNIFPHHPYQNTNIKSNRRPSEKELNYGYNILQYLLELFPSVNQLFAIGRRAEYKIYTMKNYKGYIRHPSYGGKPDFINAITKISH